MSSTNTNTAFDCIALARRWVGKSKYNWWEEHSNPPYIVNCYTFTEWIFSKFDIPLPRDLFEQLQYGYTVENPEAGDLIFTKGPWTGYIGHVGIITEHGSVIHVSEEHGTVTEEEMSKFLSNRKLKCVVRVIAE